MSTSGPTTRTSAATVTSTNDVGHRARRHERSPRMAQRDTRHHPERQRADGADRQGVGRDRRRNRGRERRRRAHRRGRRRSTRDPRAGSTAAERAPCASCPTSTREARRAPPSPRRRRRRCARRSARRVAIAVTTIATVAALSSAGLRAPSRRRSPFFVNIGTMRPVITIIRSTTTSTARIERAVAPSVDHAERVEVNGEVREPQHRQRRDHHEVAAAPRRDERPRDRRPPARARTRDRAAAGTPRGSTSGAAIADATGDPERARGQEGRAHERLAAGPVARPRSAGSPRAPRWRTRRPSRARATSCRRGSAPGRARPRA